MSGALRGAVLGVGAQLVNILLSPQRAIGNIYPNVVMQEDLVDVLEVTHHPVEKGADISDHAYLQPQQLTIQARWSDASIQAIASMFTGGDILGVLSDGALGSQSYVQQQYKLILALQASLIPFNVVTGKRKYTNMLMTRVHNVTDRHTEYSLALDISCRQIIIVSTTSTTLPANVNQANPQQTASPASSGTTQATPVNSAQSTALNIATSNGTTVAAAQASPFTSLTAGAIGLGPVK